MTSTEKTKVYKVLDLFSGCGGLSLGLHMSKSPRNSSFETVAAVDIWTPACHTYEKNLGLRPNNEGVSEELVHSLMSLHGTFDVVVGGPPCQGFSSSGKRSLDDPRNGLILEYLKAIEIVKPKLFLMENVLGFTNFQNGNLLKEVKNRARELGYSVRAAVVQASLLGVPQRRRRFILVGTQQGKFAFPGENIDSIAIGSNEVGLDVEFSHKSGTEKWSFWDAVSDLAPLKAGELNNEYISQPRNELQKYFRSRETDLTDHRAVGHRPGFIKMMSYIPEGRSAMEKEIFELIPEEIRPGSGFPNSYARIRRDLPAPTITRNFTTPSSANCIHPVQDRALSLREGARCQSFPDWFVFEGSIEEKRLQIGNAVPPLLGKALGECMLETLDQSS